MQCSNVKLFYIQEVVLRMVNYLSNQLLGPLTFPHLFPEYRGESERGAGLPVLKEMFVVRPEETIRRRLIASMGK